MKNLDWDKAFYIFCVVFFWSGMIYGYFYNF